MSNRIASHLASACTLAAALLSVGPAAAADRPLPGDRPLALQDRTMIESGRHDAWAARPRPYGRPVNGGPGYVGSDFGLGKPAYTGLGTRPDWGYSE